MSAELPTGTVTFLFTDIEGSTRLLQELGDGYADVLAEHRAVVRAALAGHGRVEVDTQGDAFFAAFATARDAVAAAAEMQREFAVRSLPVRMGLHTGEAVAGPDGYVGLDVHRAARICSAAHGGQTLLSQPTRDLAGAESRDLGEHRLKDLTAPQHLHQLLVDGLPDSFPPPATLDAATTNLPIEPTALVGRERELRDVRSLLGRDDVRLLTLTGPAGAGKTRLAVQLAADAVGEYADGVFLVDLSPLRDPNLVLPAVAQTVGLPESPARAIQDALAEFLAGRRMLLVLDNVEQVVEGAPELGRLLAACPRLEVVATSREPLRIAGEQEYPVPPLSADESVELFADRARAVRPGFEVEPNRSAIADICARLDVLPLAIELAAARVKLLPPPKLLERLEQRLTLLTTGARDAPERQRTLRAAIDWSFELLDADEQTLFARLSVFEGGCTLEAAEAVCEAEIDGLASLVDKNLLTERESASGEPRFTLLETVREYAAERLTQASGDDGVRRAHADYFLHLAEDVRARSETLPPGEATGADRFPDDFDNVRVAVDYFAAVGEVEGALRLATATLHNVWGRGRSLEPYEWLLGSLAEPGVVPLSVRTDALGAAAFGASQLGRPADARAYAEESLARARELDDKPQIEWALRVLSFVEEDLDERRRLLSECEALLRELGNERGLAWVTFLLGDIAFEVADYESAARLFAEAARPFDRLNRPFEAANARSSLGLALFRAGRYDEAAATLADALRAAVSVGGRTVSAECLAVLAALRVEDGPATSTRLLAAVSAIEAGYAVPLEAPWSQVAAETEQAARKRLAAAFEAEWSAGTALTEDEAVALALGETRPGGP